ncbi:MAG: hypothetical protein EXS63_09155, partial [Candidatus Omnitrophica bacterium]|nr:hypothetical protein [Candidatus Omnitrophota bacterium]
MSTAMTKVLKLKVKETAPEDQWDKSRVAYKAVKLENDLVVHVPPQVFPGDEVYVHSESLKYLYHVRDLTHRSYTPQWLIRKIKVKIRTFFDLLLCSIAFPHLALDLWKVTAQVHGEIAIAEGILLMLAAEHSGFPKGDILEIGSYYGFSTACLALANRSF